MRQWWHKGSQYAAECYAYIYLFIIILIGRSIFVHIIKVYIMKRGWLGTYYYVIEWSAVCMIILHHHAFRVTRNYKYVVNIRSEICTTSCLLGHFLRGGYVTTHKFVTLHECLLCNQYLSPRYWTYYVCRRIIAAWYVWLRCAIAHYACAVQKRVIKLDKLHIIGCRLQLYARYI